jgi:hypothetical protein
MVHFFPQNYRDHFPGHGNGLEKYFEGFIYGLGGLGGGFAAYLPPMRNKYSTQ